MLEFIKPPQAWQMLHSGQAIIIDIREVDEYQQMHIEQAYLKPLSLLAELPPAENPQATAIFVCHSGTRTQNNQSLLVRQGYAQAYILEGGMLAWQQAGLPLKQGVKRMPIMRQVQIIAGALVLLSLALSLCCPYALILALLVGAGLTFAGISGFCGMAKLLALMPWNRL